MINLMNKEDISKLDLSLNNIFQIDFFDDQTGDGIKNTCYFTSENNECSIKEIYNAISEFWNLKNDGIFSFIEGTVLSNGTFSKSFCFVYKHSLYGKGTVGGMVLRNPCEFY
jgi:hypothetical protein